MRLVVNNSGHEAPAGFAKRAPKLSFDDLCADSLNSGTPDGVRKLLVAVLPLERMHAPQMAIDTLREGLWNLSPEARRWFIARGCRPYPKW